MPSKRTHDPVESLRGLGAERPHRPEREGDTGAETFTILTPVLNGLPWLPECVASVDAQRAGGLTV